MLEQTESAEVGSETGPEAKNVSDEAAEVKDTLEEARANIQQIKDAIEENDLQVTVPRLRITYEDNLIIFSSQKDRPYLKFYIQDNYRKI